MKTTCLESHVTKSPTTFLPEPLAVLAARAAGALDQAVDRFVLTDDQNLGHLETQAARDVQALLRAATQRGAQAKADATPPHCPVCQHALTRPSAGHARTFATRFTSTARRTTSPLGHA